MKRFCDLKVGDIFFTKFNDEVFKKAIQNIDLIDNVLFLEVYGGLYIIEDVEKDFTILENNLGNVYISTSMDKLLLEVSE